MSKQKGVIDVSHVLDCCSALGYPVMPVMGGSVVVPLRIGSEWFREFKTPDSATTNISHVTMWLSVGDYNAVGVCEVIRRTIFDNSTVVVCNDPTVDDFTRVIRDYDANQLRPATERFSDIGTALYFKNRLLVKIVAEIRGLLLAVDPMGKGVLS